MKANKTVLKQRINIDRLYKGQWTVSKLEPEVKKPTKKKKTVIRRPQIFKEETRCKLIPLSFEVMRPITLYQTEDEYVIDAPSIPPPVRKIIFKERYIII